MRSQQEQIVSRWPLTNETHAQRYCTSCCGATRKKTQKHRRSAALPQPVSIAGDAPPARLGDYRRCMCGVCRPREGIRDPPPPKQPAHSAGSLQWVSSGTTGCYISSLLEHVYIPDSSAVTHGGGEPVIRVGENSINPTQSSDTVRRGEKTHRTLHILRR